MSIQYTADQLQRKFQGAPEGTAFARIAEVLRNEGRHEEAVELCRTGLQRNPGNLSGHLVLGKCFMELDRMEEARDQFETALRLDPRCLSAMHWLARLMTRMQWSDAAAAYYRSILEIEPWDEEAQARLSEAGPGSSAPAANAPAAASPFAPTEQPSEPSPKMEEFDLNSVADFLPAESSPSDLAGALEEVSLEEALSAPAREPDRSASPAAAEAGLAEPTPMDVLSVRDEIPPGAGEPAPISGDDVEERLDSLFGAADDKPVTASLEAVEAPATPGSEAPPELRESNMAPQDSASSSAFPFTPFEPVEEAAPPESPEQRVSGEDIEQRLDELFSLAESTGTHAALRAPETEPAEAVAPTGDDVASAFDRLEGTSPSEGLSESTAFPSMPAMESGTPVLAEEAPPEAGEVGKIEPERAGAADPEFDAIGTESIPVEAPPEDQVTGQDVADKLEALFGAEPESKPAEPLDAPFAGPTEEPELPASGSASWAVARPTGEDEATGTETREREVLPSSSSSALAGGAQALSPWEESLEAEQPPVSDMMSTESMLPRGIGLGEAPAITGEDIEDRLDSLFSLGDEGTRSGAALRASEPAVAESEGMPEADYSGGRADVTSFIEQPGFDAGDERTVVMPAMKDSAADWQGRKGGEPGSAAMEPGGNETMMLPAEASQELAQDPDSILIPDSRPSGEALFPAGTDTVGMEMVDGADIAERLDQIFAPEGNESAAQTEARVEPGPIQAEETATSFGGPEWKAAAEEAIAKGGTESAEETVRGFEDSDEARSLETGEMPLDEVALFALDPESTLPPLETDAAEPPAAETVISGEDVSARLTEIFSEPLTGTETTGQPMAEEDGIEVFPAAATWTPAEPMSEESATDTVADAAGSTMMPKDAFAAAALEAPPSGVARQQEEGEAPQTSPAPAGKAESMPAAADPATGSSILPPMLDEEEAPLEDEEENAPQSAAGANVATVTLAEIYFQQGLREQALQIYRQLLEREPGNESVRKRIQEIEASKPETGPGPGTDPRRPRPGLKVPKRKK
jgi:tetratricopeptide (TPR) repeat protein